MRRLSIRARLTIAFAASLLAVLVLAAVFVYNRVDAELSDSLEEDLGARLASLQAAVALEGPDANALAASGPPDSDEGFAQLVEPDGTVAASTLEAGVAVLGPAQLAGARSGRVRAEREVPGIEGEALIFAEQTDAGPGAIIAMVGASTQDREEALTGIVGAFAIGAPLALLLASGIGYMLARRALEPVDAMRRRADRIGGEAGGERLPLPAADDELRALGATLNSMLDRLEAALAREREFVADAGHELRTPLAILKAELELADEQPTDAAQLRRAVGSARVEVDRLIRLAEDLLIGARADHDQIPIRRERTAIYELLQRVASRFERSLDGRLLRVEASEELVAAVDPLRLEQIAGNLIDNAIRHGEGPIVVSAAREGERLELEVSDQGPGFPSEFVDSAFERFSRPDAGRSGGGAGLGLAIVRSLARAHGGEAEIVDGRPTVVRVALPLRAGPD